MPGGRPHAEAMALQQAASEAAGATAFVTLEPCAHASDRGPACATILAQARIARLVLGALDPDPRTAGAGAQLLRRAGVDVEVLSRPLVQDSLAGYFARRNFGRPHVTLKLATSLDGFIATAEGESRWITGSVARAHVHARRALADAILVGGETWRRDRPGLDVRLAGLEHRSPRRVLLSRGVAPDGVTVINSPEKISELGEVQYLYIEGGGTTAAGFIAADLVDRLEIYRAPMLIGHGHEALGAIGLTNLADAHGRWRLVEQRQLGSDSYAAYCRVR